MNAFFWDKETLAVPTVLSTAVGSRDASAHDFVTPSGFLLCCTSFHAVAQQAVIAASAFDKIDEVRKHFLGSMMTGTQFTLLTCIGATEYTVGEESVLAERVERLGGMNAKTTILMKDPESRFAYGRAFGHLPLEEVVAKVRAIDSRVAMKYHYMNRAELMKEIPDHTLAGMVPR